MTGGGFAGCIVAVMPGAIVAEMRAAVLLHYRAPGGGAAGGGGGFLLNHHVNPERANVTNTNTSTAADWWRGAVIYRISPRSFADSIGDGTGELRGFTARLLTCQVPAVCRFV